MQGQVDGKLVQLESHKTFLAASSCARKVAVQQMDNGWMHYWFNVASQASMTHGLHMDVIRFNQWQLPAGGI